MSKRGRYETNFKNEAVKAAEAAQAEGLSMSTVAAGLGVKENTLHRWVQNKRRQAENEAAGGLTAAERSELESLRRQVKRLTMEREILKKATAFFAKESA